MTRRICYWLLPLFAVLALAGCRVNGVTMEKDAIPISTTITTSPDTVHVGPVNIDTAAVAKVVSDGIKSTTYVALALIFAGALGVIIYIHRRTQAHINDIKEMTREFRNQPRP